MAHNIPKFHYRTQVIYDVRRWYFSLRIIKFKKLYKDFHACDVPLSIAIGFGKRVDRFDPQKYLILHFGYRRRNIQGLEPVGRTRYVVLPFTKKHYPVSDILERDY